MIIYWACKVMFIKDSFFLQMVKCKLKHGRFGEILFLTSPLHRNHVSLCIPHFNLTIFMIKIFLSDQMKITVIIIKVHKMDLKISNQLKCD